MIAVKLEKSASAFDVLAILCAMFTKEEERRCAIRWSNASRSDLRKFIGKYRKFIAIILNSSANEYKFNMHEIEYLNSIIAKIEETDVMCLDEVFLLAIEIENKIEVYSKWQCCGMVYQLKPLNANYMETEISVYPHFNPQWSTDKSERTRSLRLNARFQNYIIVRKGDQLPFEVIMHYWNDQGILEKTDTGWSLRIAVAPVMDSVELKMHNVENDCGKGIVVDGLLNEANVEEKILKIFDDAFKQGYGVIMFPEVIGTKRIVESIKSRMRMYPENCTLIVLPTYCCDEHNTLTVLGPGGVEVLTQEKGTPFFLRDKEGEQWKEQLQYTNEIHVLITKELGNVVFPICAEFLDPDYYPVLTNVVNADAIFCPSFSPGAGAFEKTMIKGLADMKLSIWVNTCSAKTVSVVGRIPENVAMVQLPDAKPGKQDLYKVERPCHGNCCGKACYFELNIEYRDSKFYVESVQHLCA